MYIIYIFIILNFSSNMDNQNNVPVQVPHPVQQLNNPPPPPTKSPNPNQDRLVHKGRIRDVRRKLNGSLF